MCDVISTVSGRVVTTILIISDTSEVISWTADDEGTIYADGSELHYNNQYYTTIETTIPCGTLLLAFKLEDTHTHGLLASIEDRWSTGDAGLKCTSNAVLITSDWNTICMLIICISYYYYFFSDYCIF